MNTNKKGDVGLVKSMMELTTNNYFVFTPISDTTCVDLVIGNSEMELKRAQIKYCSLVNGRVEIFMSTVINGKRVAIDLSKLDMWIIYCPDNDKLYYIPISDLVGKKSMKLRVVPPKVMSKQVTMADIYESIENAWVRDLLLPQ